MNKIVIGEANGRVIGFDLDTLCRTRLLIQADSGGGKSWLIRVIAEQAFGKVQVILIDPEGEFATLREKFDYVLVGKNGETPADPRSAALVAHRLLELRASAVCDLYELKSHLRHQWVKLFLNAMIDAPKELWRPVLIVVDEAHVYCPEKDESEAAGAMIDLATRGRKRGFCAVFATQRLAKLDKDASSELQNRLIGPTFEDVNRKRAAEVLGILKSDEREFFKQIQLLEPGNFYALGRAISTDRVLVKVRDVITSHPEMGSSKHGAEAPPAPDKIKALLPRLADLPKEAEERARSEADFRREISQLKRELTIAKNAQPAPAKPITDSRLIQSEVKKATDPLIRQIQIFQRTASTAIEFLSNATKAVHAMNTIAASSVPDVPKVSVPVTPVTALPPAVSSRPLLPDPQPRPATPVESNGLSAALVKILSRFAEITIVTGKISIPKEQLAAWSGYSPTGGGFNNYLGTLRSRGLIDYPSAGQVQLTTEGRVHAQPGDAPITNVEMLERAKQILGGSEARILEEVHRHYPDAISKPDLAAAAGFSADGGGFNNYLGHMRTLGFIDYPQKGFVRCSTWLFIE